MDQGLKLKRNTSPKEEANCCSLLFFFYTLKIFIKGFKQELEEEDVYEVLKKLKSKKVGDRLEKIWIEDKKRHKKTSVIRLMWKCYGWRVALLGTIDTVLTTTLATCVPLGTGKIVKYFSPDRGDMTIHEAYFYASVVIGVKLVDLILYNNYVLLLYEMATLVRTAFCSIMYRKSLRLSPDALTEFTTGKLVTLMTKDAHMVDHFVMRFNDCYIAVVESIVLSFNLTWRIGFVSFTGIGTLFLAIPIQIYLAKKTGEMVSKSYAQTDKRLQITQEALTAIRIIKMYTWEDLFYRNISKARKEEIVKLRNINCLKTFTYGVGFLASQLAFYVLLISYTSLVEDVSAEDVFFILSTFHYLTYAIAVLIPFSIVNAAELIAVANRISKLLNAEEKMTKPEAYPSNGVNPKVTLENVSFSIKDQNIINNVSCTFSPGLNVITGPLGSGKSSLLKVILQEYPPLEGKLDVSGTMSYASQNPWLFPASIKHNILFGEEINIERYQQVLRVCALKYDFDILINGDETIVEDNGMNLSKGQQARINLARSVYRDRDIYLLDDCLAALDSKVQDHIFRECIQKFLKNKIVIYVTHNNKSIKRANQLYYMENGTIKTIENIPNGSIKIENDTFIKKEALMEEQLDEKDDYIDTCAIIQDENHVKENLYKEIKKAGGVDYSIYKRYFMFGGGLFTFLCVFLLFVGDQFSSSYLERLLSDWVDLKANATKLIQENKTSTPEYFDYLKKQTDTFDLYSIMLIITVATLIVRTITYFVYISRISINMHKVMIKNLLDATMEFFDSTFIGNILNRFSRDLSTIDEILSFVVMDCIRMICQIAGVFGLIATVDLTYLIPSIFLIALAICFRMFYIPTSRSAKRLDASTRSPVVGHLNSTLEGICTIRAHHMEETVMREFDRHQDLYTSATHLSIMTSRAFATFLHVTCLSYVCFVIGHLLLFKTDNQAGNVGLAVTKSFQLTKVIHWGIRQWSNLENQMTSVERVLEYTDVKQESRIGTMLDNWPDKGSIKYDNVSLTYEKTNETVLKNINVTISPKEKIGIVGRTGAGKSSIISSLFRLYEVDGRVIIDGVDCRELSLKFIRSSISIIPQDPVLFRASIRSNIDPFGKYSDEEIWNVIETVKLKNIVSDLDCEISGGGTEFSAGQRQLFCLARSLIKKNKIVVLDEATANIDAETDVIINRIIQEEFAPCTVLTIAHKLDSIAACDRVMVLEKGKIAEFDKPQVLVNNKDSNFYGMLQHDR